MDADYNLVESFRQKFEQEFQGLEGLSLTKPQSQAVDNYQ
jgi:hypothetical protein